MPGGNKARRIPFLKSPISTDKQYFAINESLHEFEVQQSSNQESKEKDEIKAYIFSQPLEISRFKNHKA